MTPLTDIYNAFLGQIEDDSYAEMTSWEVKLDLRDLLNHAIVWFKFPRVSLEIVEGNKDDIEPHFASTLGNAEIQVIVAYMKGIWIERLVNSVENLRPLYQERDFSPAKMLGEFRQKHTDQMKLADQLERKYYRSINYQTYNYGGLVGGGKNG